MFFFAFFGMAYILFLVGFFWSFFGWGGLFDFFLFKVGAFEVGVTFVLDYVSFGFFSCVSFISAMVFMYSVFYMEGTIDSRRFSWLVFGFVFSMSILVFSGNFFLTMVGWDGLGLVSFCLVIFYSNHGSLESGLVTVFSNRVGDVFFLICFYFFFLGGSFTFDFTVYFWDSLFFIFIFLGAITKSAQVPFSAWLPSAMAAPTPVSSLVHSSTLVTAGVYVLIRFCYLFFFMDFIFFKFFFILSMFVAGVCANFEKDFKKVVAMSTLSQLGMMLFILSVGVWLLSFLHMVIHAFFKSMLFLSMGSLMSHLGGNQDSRFYGGSFGSYSSFLYFCVSSVCLAGFPFYIGFYSKDFIILGSSYGLGFFFYFVFIFSCLFTIFYSLRLILLGYHSWFKSGSGMSYLESYNFVVPVSLLFFKGWLLGGLFYWLFLSEMSVFFCFFDVTIGIFLLGVGFYFYRFLKMAYPMSLFFCTIVFMRWFSAGGSTNIFSKKVFHKWDSSWFEFFGGQGSYYFLASLSKFFDFYKAVSLGTLVFFLVGFSLVLFLS